MTKKFERFVRPVVFPMSHTVIDKEGLYAYLVYTGQEQFVDAIEAATKQGLSEAEVLCSFYAKLCYKALVADGRNANVTRTRDIWDNLVATFDSAHGSVFEHVQFGFVITDCSRVYTHEQVRHRIGVAYSQTSGRYTRLDQIPLVWDPLLDDCRDIAEDVMQKIEDSVYLMECRKGLRVPNPERQDRYSPETTLEMLRSGDMTMWELHHWVPNSSLPFDVKKKITSAIRRIAPNGQANELGYTVNLRALRHIIQMRTATAAEWEIRQIYSQIFDILRKKYPLIFYGAKERMVDGAVEVTGMKINPYERTPRWEEMLVGVSDDEIHAFLLDRKLAS